MADADEDADLTAGEHTQWWNDWLRRGPHGPIDDDDATAFPDAED